MRERLHRMIENYNPQVSLEEASTIPSSWYTDQELFVLEKKSIFTHSWQFVGRADQVQEPGQYFTYQLADEPIVVVRGDDKQLRAFYNVCRHHAAQVMTKAEGRTEHMRCPYHGWTYALDGSLKGVTEFQGVCNFDKSKNGLLPIRVEVWEKFVFVCLHANAPNLKTFLGDLVPRFAKLKLNEFSWRERRRYQFQSNWKVFVDNYLDGGYHIPYIHKGLGSVLKNSEYQIETKDRFCLQYSPVHSESGDDFTKKARKGQDAYYYWLYPNFMLNWYEGIMDTNLVIPRGIDQTEVIFDFYFVDNSEAAEQLNRHSVEIGQKIQDEDVDICASVQRGLKSRAYDVGRLSVRREAGEHLFHKLLHKDLRAGLEN